LDFAYHLVLLNETAGFRFSKFGDCACDICFSFPLLYLFAGDYLRAAVLDRPLRLLAEVAECIATPLLLLFFFKRLRMEEKSKG